MARNKVQFQKSMSIHSFISQFGTEEQCRKHLFSLRWPTGFTALIADMTSIAILSPDRFTNVISAIISLLFLLALSSRAPNYP